MNRGGGARSNDWTLQYEACDLAYDGMVERLDANLTNVEIKCRVVVWSFDTPTRVCPRGILGPLAAIETNDTICQSYKDLL